MSLEHDEIVVRLRSLAAQASIVSMLVANLSLPARHGEDSGSGIRAVRQPAEVSPELMAVAMRLHHCCNDFTTSIRHALAILPASSGGNEGV
jgi:hypothetical protein